MTTFGHDDGAPTGTGPIDAVIAWVDGADPAHAARRALHRGEAESSFSDAVLPTRFADCGEVYACIASILKFAPWMRRIWLLTDQQRPALLGSFAAEGLCAPDRIAVVDHREAFRGYEHLLPTFNSLSIGAVLWRIEGLAERFVYFNDDVFLNRPAVPEDFFRDGAALVHARSPGAASRLARRLRQLARRARGLPPDPRTSLKRAAEISAALAGRPARVLQPAHQPHPMRRSPLAAFHERRPEVLEAQLSFRFRNAAQFLPSALSYQLELEATGGPVRPMPELAYLNGATVRTAEEARAILGDETAPFACLQSLDLAPEEVRREVAAMLARRYGSHLPGPVLGRLAALEDAAP